MCLGIPGQVVELVDRDAGLAKVDISGVRRDVSVALVDDPAAPVEIGDWVLIHVGYALQKISAEEAQESWELFAELLTGEASSHSDPCRFQRSGDAARERLLRASERSRSAASPHPLCYDIPASDAGAIRQRSV